MEREGSQVDLFVAVLVRFPQIGTIQYDPEAKSLRLTFLLRESQADFSAFIRSFESHLAVFHSLRQASVGLASLKQTTKGALTTLEVIRDVDSLSLSELNLIVELVSDYYGEAVVKEGPEMAEEDEVEQNMLIDALLMSSPWPTPQRLTGFRENGRVLVFSVPLGVGE
ncbi:MAG: hypothetical protein GX249_11430 [Firmicutes bacterium]|nr:hypothetical protein [Bacillota bacterium]